MVETGEPFAIEKRYLRPDGAEVWVHNHVSLTRGPDGCPRYVTALVQDISGRRRAEERRALLVAELNHRVKNTLAIGQALARQTVRGADDLRAFATTFQARLLALARAHDLLTREDWTGAPLDAALRAALDPLALDAAHVDLSGCASDLFLPPASALALAMAVHELATNARKHGALSVPGGRVSIACRRQEANATPNAAPVVEWTERGGPPVAGPPAKRGFGLRLLGRGLGTEAGIGANLRFEPEGVRCVLRLPSSPQAATRPEPRD